MIVLRLLKPMQKHKACGANQTRLIRNLPIHCHLILALLCHHLPDQSALKTVLLYLMLPPHLPAHWPTAPAGQRQNQLRLLMPIMKSLMVM